MSEYHAHLQWNLNEEEDFARGRYARRHSIRFDNGLTLTASSSVHVVPEPWSDPSALDPEAAFVASLSSCHLLWFLSLAQAGGFTVHQYEDSASGVLARNAQGRMAMTVVTLRPQVSFEAGRQPDSATFDALHHEAHERCFIANSVTSEVRCKPSVK